jgi:hypothetical protein
LSFEGALRWNSAGQVTPLGTLDGPLDVYYTAVAINSASVSVGQYRTTTGLEHPLQWDADGSLVPLGTPAGFSEASARDINDDGLIVGQAGTAANQIALIHAEGAWIDLNSLLIDADGWHLHSAVAINNGGAIVGTGTLDGASRAFLLTPVALDPADFNRNGTVDAADYVVWRKSDGTPDHYAMWRSHFGLTVASGATASRNAAVPEPTTPMLLWAAAGSVLVRCRWASSRGMVVRTP